MWSEKLNFVEKSRLKIASATAPFKKTGRTSLDNLDLILSLTLVKEISNFELKDKPFTNDICAFSQINIASFDFTPNLTSTFQIAEPTLSGNLNSFIEVQFFYLKINRETEITTNFSPLHPSEIFDLTEIAKENWQQTIILDIEFKLRNFLTFGKNYETVSEKKNPQQPTLFGDGTAVTREPSIKTKPKPQSNSNDSIDLFDLIFPVLQPSLGSNFNNLLTLPHQLYPFQNEGIRFLAESPSALLGDEMGLGKSIQTIVALKILFRQGKILNSGIICPKAVIGDWEKKFWEWAPELKVIRVEGGVKERRLLWASKYHVYIFTYETYRNDLNFTSSFTGIKISDKGHSFVCENSTCKTNLLIPYEMHNKFETILKCPHCLHKFSYPLGNDIAKTNFDLVVFDEIQKIKNPEAGITKASSLIHANYKWALSGTPLENKLEDLLTILSIIKKDIFKGVNLKDIKQIKETYQPYFKRRKKEDVLKELPPKITKHIWLELTPNQRKAYDLAEKHGIIELKEKGETVTLQHILALITKLKQICNFEPSTEDSIKFEYLKEELEEITGQGDKALVFSQYVTTLKKIEPKIPEYKPLVYEGSLNTNQRSNYEKIFQQGEENKVMLISLKAGNAGITLTRANYVYLFDLWWNPSVSEQAVGRIHRISQTKTVFERILLAENTIERRIYDILAEKKSLFNRIVDDLSDTGDLNSLLTQDELFGLFGLSRKTKVETQAEVEETTIDLTPLEFEEYVAKIFNKLGYSTKLTKKSHDGGIDIHARKPTPTGFENIIIQCKYKEDPAKTVGVDKIHSLYGVLQADRSINKAILVTNGRFSSECENFASGKTIELINGIKLKSLSELHK